MSQILPAELARRNRARRWMSRRVVSSQSWPVPERLYGYLASKRPLLVKNCSNSTSEWVSAKFSPTEDNLLCLGGNDGSVGVYNILPALEDDVADLDSGMVSSLKAHSGAVMGVYGVPGQSKELLSIGGDGTAKIFDMETKNRLACFEGHETIVRSASFLPDSSNEFVTCGRDGKFCLYDRRCQSKRDRSGIHFIPASQYIAEAHYTTDGGKQYKDLTSVPGLTNIVYLDENSIVTSSDKAITGIRFWDPRKLTKRPVRTLEIPYRRQSKQSGFASMTLDRFSSSLFAAVTDNNIYEFDLGCDQQCPVRKFTQAGTNSYDVTIAASPVSDHLLSGSVQTDGCFLFNVPSKHSHEGDIASQLEEVRPTFKLEGHDTDVTAVSWSRDGKYIATLDESRFRIWSASFERDEEENFIRSKDTLPVFTRITFVGEEKKSLSVMNFQKLAVSPMKPQFISPVKKRMRLGSASSSPLLDRTNLLPSPGRPSDPLPPSEFDTFCSRHLTRNLPQRRNVPSIETPKKEGGDTDKKKPRNLSEFFSKQGEVTSKTDTPSPERRHANVSMRLFASPSPIPPSTPSCNSIKRYFRPAPHNRRLK